jgi:pimeloyl-ACP methyl ester carboxylesterase
MEGPPIPASVREDFIVSYEGDRFAESITYVRQYPVDLRALRDMLRDIKIPVQLITGKRDGFVPIANEQYLQEHLASSVLHVLDAGHFVWEEAADAFADLVVSWIAGGYARAP